MIKVLASNFVFFPGIMLLFYSGRGSFLVLSAAGHAGAPRLHTAQDWTPAEVRVACSGSAKSRSLASNYGSVSAEPEPARTKQIPQFDNSKLMLCCCMLYHTVLPAIKHCT